MVMLALPLWYITRVREFHTCLAVDGSSQRVNPSAKLVILVSCVCTISCLLQHSHTNKLPLTSE